jgi:hypothetical protein
MTTVQACHRQTVSQVSNKGTLRGKPKVIHEVGEAFALFRGGFSLIFGNKKGNRSVDVVVSSNAGQCAFLNQEAEALQDGIVAITVVGEIPRNDDVVDASILKSDQNGAESDVRIVRIDMKQVLDLGI